MNKEWSELNKSVQIQLKKEETFAPGMETLLKLRQQLMQELLCMKRELSGEEFCTMPFPNAAGYHSKTIAYSVWHIFRIEDIVANSLIRNEPEVLRGFTGKIGTSVITTGNELAGQQIVDFSKSLDLDVLYAYALAVKDTTDSLLRQFAYSDLKRTFKAADKERLRLLQVVSTDDRACWLIDFWCGKNIRGLIQMPFSRHWIMHIEACKRIASRKNLDRR